MHEKKILLNPIIYTNAYRPVEVAVHSLLDYIIPIIDLLQIPCPIYIRISRVGSAKRHSSSSPDFQFE